MITSYNLFTKTVLSAGLLTLASMATADHVKLDAPTSAVVLTVSGDITQANVSETAQFDMQMLEAMPATEFTTNTAWMEGPQTFRGVLLSEFLHNVGAEGNTLSAMAINDYAVSIPTEDAVEGGPIIAYSLNDAAMSRREKGPLWIVYPYDKAPEYRTEVIYSRSIWQLDRIVVQ